MGFRGGIGKVGKMDCKVRVVPYSRYYYNRIMGLGKSFPI